MQRCWQHYFLLSIDRRNQGFREGQFTGAKQDRMIVQQYRHISTETLFAIQSAATFATSFSTILRRLAEAEFLKYLL